MMWLMYLAFNQIPAYCRYQLPRYIYAAKVFASNWDETCRSKYLLNLEIDPRCLEARLDLKASWCCKAQG